MMPTIITTTLKICRLNTDVLAVTANVKMAPTAIQNRQMPVFIRLPSLENILAIAHSGWAADRWPPIARNSPDTAPRLGAGPRAPVEFSPWCREPSRPIGFYALDSG